MTCSVLIEASAGTVIQLIDDEETVLEEWEALNTPHEIYNTVIGRVYTLQEVDLTAEGSDVRETFCLEEDGTITYSGTLTEDGNIFFGSNTDSAYQIRTAEDWDAFANKVAGGEYETDKTWTLCADITVTTTVGTEEHPFEGTFDGNGHTLTVDLFSFYDQGVAPFRYIRGANIYNLTVEGAACGRRHSAGLVGFILDGGTSTILNCVVNVDVDDMSENTTYVGGVVGHAKSSALYMDHVIFGGGLAVLKADVCGGLVGWYDAAEINLTDCLCTGSYAGSGSFHPVIFQNSGGSLNCTIERVYYTENPSVGGSDYSILGDAKQVRTMPQRNTLYRPVTAADNKEYYLSCFLKEFQDLYLINESMVLSFSEIGGTGISLTEGTDYTTLLTLDGNEMSALECAGKYTLTITGMGEYAGTIEKQLTVAYGWDFEGDAPIAGWTMVSCDKDSFNWAVGTDRFQSHSGKKVLWSASYLSGLGAISPDNWAIMPAILVSSNAELSFWIAGQDPSYPSEVMGVYIGTDNNPENMVQIGGDYTATADYTRYTVDLSAYKGETVYIAFRHYNVSGQYQLVLDDVIVKGNCSVMFDTDGGSDVETQSVMIGGRAAKPDNPVKDGYIFDGWYKVVDGVMEDTAFDFENSAILTNITLKAKYIPGPSFATLSLTLSGKIGVNFYMDLPAADQLDYSESYMEFTVGDSGGFTDTVQYDPDTKNKSGEYYGFSCYVSAIQMADSINAVFHYKENGEEKTLENITTIQNYIEQFDLTQELYSPEAIELIEALADYGHYAQILLSDVRGWVLGEDYAEMIRHYKDSYNIDTIRNSAEQFCLSTNSSSSDVAGVSFSLMLDSGTDICVYFTLNEDYTGTKTFVLDGSTVAAEEKNGRYLVKIPSISAHLLGDPHYVALTTETGIYQLEVSALSYVYTVLSSDPDDRSANACAALYNYYKAAKDYPRS